MAKAKKSASESESASKPAKAPAAPKRKPAAGASSKARKPTKASTPAAQPMIDTTLAAQNAAAMLVAGLKKPAAAPASNAPGAPKSESAMFKQLKAGLNKPHATTMSNLLEKSHGPDTTKSHEAFNKQVGHNQTYGADVTRSGVPRRTPG